MKNKIALVTGANKGIGFETARNLGQKGYRVYLGARDKTRGEAAVKNLQNEKLDVHFLQLDVTSDASVRAAAAKLTSDEGVLDILINNAGVYLMGKDGPASTTAVETLIETYEVNVFGPMRVTQAFVPLLKKSENASIVMVSSALGSITLLADPNGTMSTFEAIAYNSSKSALNGIMVGFATDLRASGIKVNSVNPGYNSTELNGNQGTYPPSHGAAIVVKAAYIDAKNPTATFVDEGADCPW